MIVMNDVVYEKFEETQPIVDFLIEEAYKDEMIEVAKIFQDFLREAFAADERLQKMLDKKFPDTYISYVRIPFDETEILDAFYFNLAHKKGKKVKRRDQLFYDDLCSICFGHIQTYYSRLMDYFG